MSTDVDGAAPSVAPDPGDDAGRGDAGWLQQEIRRRAARAGSSSGGRHARRGITEPPSTAHEYVPRHGNAVPAPAPPRHRVAAPDVRAPDVAPLDPRAAPTADRPGFAAPPPSAPAPGERAVGALPPAAPAPDVRALGPLPPAAPALGERAVGALPPAAPAPDVRVTVAPPAVVPPPEAPPPAGRPPPAARPPHAGRGLSRVPLPPRDGDVAPPTTPLTITPSTFTPPVRPTPAGAEAPPDDGPAAGAPRAAGPGAPTMPRTSETMPGGPHLPPVSSLGVTGTRPGLAAVRPRPVTLSAPGAATAAGPGAPSRPDLPRRRPRLEPPSGPAAARLLGTADDEPEAPAPPRAGASSVDVRAPGAPDVEDRDPDLDERAYLTDDEDDDEDDDGLLDEDLDADGEVVLWSAAGPSAVPEQRSSEATPDGSESGGAAGVPLGARFPRQDDPSPQRVRVVLSERKGMTRAVRNVVELQESGTVGDLLRGDLIRSQLRVALLFALVGGLVLGLLPVLFATVPEVGRFEVLGIRVPWLVLGLLVYPFLFGLGWLFTRRAEHVEQEFADKVQD